MGAMHMSLLGPEGLQHLAVRNMAASTQLKRQLSNVDSVHLPYADQSHFNEFVVELPATTSECLAHLEGEGIIGGFDVSHWYPEKTNQMLLSVTDQTSQHDIDRLIQSLSKLDEGGERLSRLLGPQWCRRKGPYAQPAPLLPDSELDLPSNMTRKELPRWPRLLRTRDGSTLHMVVQAKLSNRYWLLSTRVMYDETQSPRQ